VAAKGRRETGQEEELGEGKEVLVGASCLGFSSGFSLGVRVGWRQGGFGWRVLLGV
jgi:hypothetical protein